MNWQRWAALAAGGVLVVVAVFVLVFSFYFPNVGAAPDLAIDATPDRVARGEILFARMGCNDCHTPSLEPARYSFVGDLTKSGGGKLVLTPENGAPGTVYAPNITPYALADWTDGEIFRAIVSGVSRDGRALFPMMPYEIYGTLDRRDIEDIIAYMRQMQPVERDTPASQVDFPFSLIIKTIPREPAFTTRPDPSDTIATGHYLSRAYGCSDCHTKFENGAFVGAPYAGNREFLFKDWVVRSSNLTPDDDTGIGQWSREIFISRFRAQTMENLASQIITEGEPNTPMPWWYLSALPDEELGAIHDYLMSLEPVASPVTRFEPRG